MPFFNKDCQRGEIATVVALMGLVIVTAGIFITNQLVKTGPRDIPRAQTTCTSSITVPANGAIVDVGSTFSWNSCSGAVNYQLKIADAADSSNSYTYAISSSANSITIPSGIPIVQAGEQYELQVRACFDSNCSSTSSWSSVKTYWWKFINTVTPIQSPTRTPTKSPTKSPTKTPTPTSIYANGDANEDGYVDGIDYTIWLANYGKNTTNLHKAGDFNRDGKTDGLDYVIWLKYYQPRPTPTTNPTITITPTAIPLPTCKPIPP